MEESKYAKILAKIQVGAIFHIQDIRRNVLPKFIELCMKTLCWCPSEEHQHGGRKPVETSVTKVLLLKRRDFISRLIHKHKSYKFSKDCSDSKSPKISHLFNLHDSSLGRHVNAVCHANC